MLPSVSSSTSNSSSYCAYMHDSEHGQAIVYFHRPLYKVDKREGGGAVNYEYSQRFASDSSVTWAVTGDVGVYWTSIVQIHMCTSLYVLLSDHCPQRLPVTMVVCTPQPIYSGRASSTKETSL